MANRKPTIRNVESDWTEAQEKQLKKLYPTTNNDVLAKMLNRTESAIRAKATKMRLKKADRFWDKSEEDFILKNVTVMSYPEIAKKLKRTKWAVINKYRELIGKR